METRTTSLKRLWANDWVRYGCYLLLLLPLLLRREITPTNELKYLQIADEALRDGHFWCLYLDGAPYADKPPLYLWIIMACKRLLGFHCIPLLELFSLLPAFGVLAVFNRWCGASLRPEWRYVAEAALLTTAYFLGGALVLRMDMLMVLFITLAMQRFWLLDRGGPDRRSQRIFAVFVFLAIFSKGPVGLLFPLLGSLAWLAWERRLRDFGRAWGWRTWLILAVLCGIWWAFAYREGGAEYLRNLLFHQTFDRAVNAFHHPRPWYWYLYTAWYAMGPWSLLTIPVSVWGAWRRKTDPLTRFCLVVSLTFFVVMSCFSGKLQIYLLPMFGFVNYAAFRLLNAEDDGVRYWPVVVRNAAYGVAGAMLAACVAAGFLFPNIF